MGKERVRMHQTTVRFTPDLWWQLEQEAERSGVSAAQYVREATLARLAYTAGQRGDSAFGSVQAASPAEAARAVARERISDSAAVLAQAQQARARARATRESARVSDPSDG
jgi:hypothetical protein